mmetsp:Transcript_50518/g.126852  ORF Transcript_50518/g.126852 Transcript_50518/m.126852 type:complete len:240 (-) Transcript_50518:124-843(-)
MEQPRILLLFLQRVLPCLLPLKLGGAFSFFDLLLLLRRQPGAMVDLILFSFLQQHLEGLILLLSLLLGLQSPLLELGHFFLCVVIAERHARWACQRVGGCRPQSRRRSGTPTSAQLGAQLGKLGKLALLLKLLQREALFLFFVIVGQNILFTILVRVVNRPFFLKFQIFGDALPFCHLKVFKFIVILNFPIFHNFVVFQCENNRVSFFDLVNVVGDASFLQSQILFTHQLVLLVEHVFS